MKLANFPHGTRTEQSQRDAYVILVSIQNIANFFHMQRRIFLDLAIEMEGLTPTMISLFTHNREVAAVSENNRHKTELAQHWERFAMNTFFGLAGVFSMAAGPAAIPLMAIIAAEGAISGELLDQAYKHKKIGKRAVSNSSTPDWQATRAQFPIGAAGDDAAKFIHHFGGLNATQDDIDQVSKHLYSWLTLQDAGFQ